MGTFTMMTEESPDVPPLMAHGEGPTPDGRGGGGPECTSPDGMWWSPTPDGMCGGVPNVPVLMACWGGFPMSHP